MNTQPMLVTADLADAVGKLSRYAFARDRATERTPRVISISDDEAVALLMALGWVSKPLPPRDDGRPTEIGETP
jgi:hypothetical protein